jgi:hypothetical protein
MKVNIDEKNNFTSPTNDNRKGTKTELDNRQAMGSESKRLSLGTISQSEAVARTIEESTNENTRGCCKTSKRKQNKSWIKSKGLRQLAKRAKANGTWIDNLISITDGNGYFEKGTENYVYLSKDGINVIKANNLSFLNNDSSQFTYTRDLNYFFDRISIHNLLFPEDAYDIIGFTNDVKKMFQ